MNNEIKLLAPPKGNTYRIPEGNLSKLSERLSKLNEEASKLDSAPIHFDIMSTDDVKDEKTGEISRFFNVYVEGEAPKLKGWTFVGALTHAPEGNIVRPVPGKVIPDNYRTNKPVCDHCKKDWIVRRDTYIVQNDQGVYKQVGGNCLADFLGHPDPYRYARFAEWLAGLHGELEELENEKETNNSPQFKREDLKMYLAEVAAVVDEKGWKSRGAVYQEHAGTATADYAMNELHDTPHTYHGVTTYPIRPQQKHFDEAEKVISYLRVDLKPDNDYLNNLKTLTSVDNFLVKEGSGIVASAIPFYRREIEKQVAKAKQASQFAQQALSSNYVGEVGDRLYGIHVSVLSHQELESNFGMTNLFRFQDDKGNVYSWFGTGAAAYGMEVGNDYVISASVKKHQEYKGRKETILTRVKIDS